MALAALTSDDSGRHELDHLELGVVDSSVVALADVRAVRRLATRDIRDFAPACLSEGRAFELVVHPTDLDGP